MSRLKKTYEKSFSYKFRQFMNGELATKEIPFTVDNNSEELDEKEPVAKATEFYEEFAIADDKQKHHMYEELMNKKSIKTVDTIYKILSTVICLGIISILLLTVAYLPKFGNQSNPDNNIVSERYIEKGLEETGAVNVVAGMILDYRAFDTFGESTVLFIACCLVLIILRNDSDKEENDEIINDYVADTILIKISKIIVPLIIIFGIYIVLNGHLSPGGGFSGGALMGAALILYANAYGFKRMEKLFNYKTFKTIIFSALLCYGTCKTYSFFTGANHLESGIPLGTPGAILSSGLILILNICVGLVVACTMYGFYALFKRGRI